ncbi:MAG TPA: hypothetical protein VFV41_10485 [Streptosporangiaceae bacterium]|nr:hypothetical protein [Streptosporangiaceae bacterium]
MPGTPVLTRLAALVVAAGAVAALAGCGQIDAALGKQWAVVDFRPDTTVATLTQVRQACAHVPNVRPMGRAQVHSGLDVTYSVRYETSHASEANLAALQKCLLGFSAVSGVSFEDISDQG